MFRDKLNALCSGISGFVIPTMNGLVDMYRPRGHRDRDRDRSSAGGGGEAVGPPPRPEFCSWECAKAWSNRFTPVQVGREGRRLYFSLHVSACVCE